MVEQERIRDKEQEKTADKTNHQKPTRTFNCSLLLLLPCLLLFVLLAICTLTTVYTYHLICLTGDSSNCHISKEFTVSLSENKVIEYLWSRNNSTPLVPLIKQNYTSVSTFQELSAFLNDNPSFVNHITTVNLTSTPKLTDPNLALFLTFNVPLYDVKRNQSLDKNTDIEFSNGLSLTSAKDNEIAVTVPSSFSILAFVDELDTLLKNCKEKSKIAQPTDSIIDTLMDIGMDLFSGGNSSHPEIENTVYLPPNIDYSFNKLKLENHSWSYLSISFLSLLLIIFRFTPFKSYKAFFSILFRLLVFPFTHTLPQKTGEKDYVTKLADDISNMGGKIYGFIINKMFSLIINMVFMTMILDSITQTETISPSTHSLSTSWNEFSTIIVPTSQIDKLNLNLYENSVQIQLKQWTTPHPLLKDCKSFHFHYLSHETLELKLENLTKKYPFQWSSTSKSIHPSPTTSKFDKFKLGTGIELLFYIGIAIFLAMKSSLGPFGGNEFMKVESDVTTRFSDVAGLDEAKGEVEEIVDILRNPEKYKEMGAVIPKGLLMSGPSGTGKTLLAKAIAGESACSFISLSGSSFDEMYVGVGSSRVRKLFSTARKSAPCIIFIDEIDALGKRGKINSESDTTLNQLLVEMDGFPTTTGRDGIVIVLAATNRPQHIDTALKRPGRFDRHVSVSLPDKNGRRDIFSVHLRGLKLGEDEELKNGFLGRLKEMGKTLRIKCDAAGVVGTEFVDVVKEDGNEKAGENVAKVAGEESLSHKEDDGKGVVISSKNDCKNEEGLSVTTVSTKDSQINQNSTPNSAAVRIGETKLATLLSKSTALQIENAEIKKSELEILLSTSTATQIQRAALQIEKATLISAYADKLSGMTTGFSGADIKNICNESAILACRHSHQSITLSTFDLAIERVIAGLAKSKNNITPNDKKILAHHEAGHACIAYFIEHSDPLVKVSIVPRAGVAEAGGQTLGFAQYSPRDRYLLSKEMIMAKMMVALGGRIAEKIFFNSITSGAQDDLQKVTSLAYWQVRELGMDDTVGLFSYSNPQDGTPRIYSEETAQLIDRQVRELVQRAYDRTMCLMLEKRDLVEKVALFLWEREVLVMKDLEGILGKREWVYEGDK